ncbi:fumarylacetoacetate hydrolase family protein [Pseudoclavibacter chungangensis]|uniref:Fumarylacetoacetate hydrolase family protein n=1 Tax=Pseudoclavibacter chungangensis TaxID=587635 RepID=A0A7J5C0L6_9MICO|nr:fumarylacetoacetate hydrolase family protein [Pseudoclavibacter chungangensis]KAB1662159.1 fumarylacetoacetate hydrolase family protein [Pseudoclavibacter chungangensis]NYJ65343.1 2-keto-4-pentenoate hydratase/2-oxohepta-3-ene-1,7-dioic acid hydratase in catechol pathway/regulator of RNase E activity RraA [Pseudoclavibacter chungangensis]
MAIDFAGAHRPGKIIALHLNYPSRIAQRGRSPKFPGYFLKAGTSVAGTGGTIERPAGTELLAYEGEIALVIGETCRRVTPEEGWSKVSGVTAANDWGLYDLRYADKGSNVKNKSGDGFTPLGPEVIPATAVEPTGLRVRTWVNGVLEQDDTTADLVFPFGRLVADLSALMTLEAGDVILTGTPAGSSVARPGDVVEVEVDAPDAPGAPSTGRLVTTVVEGSEPIPAHSAPPQVDDAQRIEAWGSAEAAGIAEAGPVITPELREKVAATAVATLSAALRKRGINNSSIDGVRTNKPGERILGTAHTLRFIPNREDLFASHGGGFNAQKRAIDTVAAGDVVVMEARGEKGTGTVGDVLALRAQVRGAAGIVTDGGVRDSAAVAELDLPVYSSGSHPAVLGRRHVPWEVGGTIACGGTAVQPGDVIVGDDDGVIVIPPPLFAEVVEEAYAQEQQDAWVFDQVAAGEPVDGLFPPNAEWKARYAAWRESQQ